MIVMTSMVSQGLKNTRQRRRQQQTFHKKSVPFQFVRTK